MEKNTQKTDSPRPSEAGEEPLDPAPCSAWKPIGTAMTYENVGKQIIVANKKSKIGRATVLSGELLTSVEDPTLWIPFPPFPRT